MTRGLGRTFCVALNGVAGVPVEVEACITSGLPGFTISGLPDRAIAQAPDRIRAAMGSVHQAWSQLRIVVNLSPASLPKQGTGFDLPIAVAVLLALGLVPAQAAHSCHVGELGLDGSIRPVRGVLPSVLAASRAGLGSVVVPTDNAREASLVDGIAIHPAASISELLEGYQSLATEGQWPHTRGEASGPEANSRTSADLREVVGQHQARLALELAAAGGHNLRFTGPPGTGKTMLAERLVTILPRLSDAQALEVQAIRSLHGLPGSIDALPTEPPYVAPHHSASQAALIGGGSGFIRPGDVSRAHHGVLFLDEAGEFRSGVLQALRQPVESGYVEIARAAMSVRFPAQFQLVLATNPCPCGNYGASDSRCTCSSIQLRRYAARLTGPLLDRLDIQVRVPRVTLADLALVDSESSATVAQRVREARQLQRQRWGPLGLSLNARIPAQTLRESRWRLPRAAVVDLERALDRGAVTLRGYDRVTRLSWTVADSHGRTVPERSDVDTALMMRRDAA